MERAKTGSSANRVPPNPPWPLGIGAVGLFKVIFHLPLVSVSFRYQSPQLGDGSVVELGTMTLTNG